MARTSKNAKNGGAVNKAASSAAGKAMARTTGVAEGAKTKSAEQASKAKTSRAKISKAKADGTEVSGVEEVRAAGTKSAASTRAKSAEKASRAKTGKAKASDEEVSGVEEVRAAGTKSAEVAKAKSAEKASSAKTGKAKASSAEEARVAGTKSAAATTAKSAVKAKSAARKDEQENAPKTAASVTGEVIFSLRAGTPIYVKTADICSAFGKTNQWIGQLTAQGVIHKSQTSHGSLYEIFDTVRSYCAYLEERAKKVDEDTAELELRRKKADAEYKESKAIVAELEAAEYQGTMHRSEDVQKMTADLLFAVRGALRALAGRCATDCAACSSPAEVQKIIEREVSEILKDLSEYKYDRKKYDELVRQRMKREELREDEEDDE